MNYFKYRADQQFFVSQEGKIAYIDQGTSNNVILLLHGVPTSGWLYRKMMLLLVDKGYRVIVPDMLGFGNSDNPESYHIYHEKKHAKRLLGLMDYLRIDSWIHVFHDAGGLWTWELLKLAPQNVKKLIILNTIIYQEGFKPPMRFGKNWFTKTVMSLYVSKLFNGFLVNQLLKKGLSKSLSDESLEGYKLPLLEGKVRGMYYFFSRTCHLLPNYKNLLPTLKIPALVIWGKNDPFLKWDPQAEQVIHDLKIKPDNVHVIDAKHFIQEDCADQIVNIINDEI